MTLGVNIMNYYQKHIFICMNQRAEGRKCCQDADAQAMHAYAKQCLRDLALLGKSQYRINQSGCLGRCAEGPALVIYPEGVWYTYATRADIDEIIAEHVLKGKVVKRLLLE